jgi:hypothetical protein
VPIELIKEALNALIANDAVPNKEPVIPLDTVNEFKEASEPDTMTRFHDGIVYNIYLGNHG